MTEDPRIRAAKAEFFSDLRRAVARSGMTQRDISRVLKMPASTLSDVLRGKNARIPGPALLADVLTACHAGAADLERWERRRVALVDGEESDEAEVDRLVAELDEATAELGELHDSERRLHAELDRTTAQRDELAAQLDRERQRNDRSAEQIAKLNGQVLAAERHIRILGDRIYATTERARQAEIAAAHLRADLATTELALFYERYRRAQDRERPVVHERPGAEAGAEANGGGDDARTSVNDLRASLHGQKSMLADAQRLCLGALEILQATARGVAGTLRGTAATGTRETLVLQLGASSEELTGSIRAMDEFAIRMYRVSGVLTERMKATADQVQQARFGVAECQQALDGCRAALADLAAVDAECAELAGLVAAASLRLETSQGSTLSAMRTLDDYAAAL